MIYDLIVVGGGTAGLTAALYALRGGLSVLLLEGSAPGGQIISSPEVDNYPALPGLSGVDYAQKLLAQVHSAGVTMRYEQVTGLDAAADIKTVRTKNAAYQARTLIWAAGVKPRRIGCPGEERLIGRGVSYCATCDGALYRDRPVAVVGGGNTALTEALFLAGICQEVHLIHRRAEFRGEAVLAEKVRGNAGIVLHMQDEVAEIFGEKRVEGLRLKSGRELAVAAVFAAVGREPENNPLSGSIDLDEQGYVPAGEDCHTEQPGVFVAGDCRRKPLRQLVTAAADGAVAATAAIEHIRLAAR